MDWACSTLQSLIAGSCFKANGTGFWGDLLCDFTNKARASVLRTAQVQDGNSTRNTGPLALGLALFILGLAVLIREFYEDNQKEESRTGINLASRNTRKILHNTESSSEDETLEGHGSDPNPISNLIHKVDDETDPGLLKKHSSFRSYTTSVATYPSIRTFFCPHPQIEKLPTKPYPLPLLVFVHGLGGSLAQFHPLLATLTNVAPCFGIDFPGCGRSHFSLKTWSAYSIESLAELLSTAIEKHRDQTRNQKVIFIGHSLGCSIATLIVSSQSSIAFELKKHVAGFVSLCPQAAPPAEATVTQFKRLLYIPEFIFNAWRRWDRRGGLDSHSVSRMVGKGAEPETKKLQLKFNEQSRTPVWRRMAWGTLPEFDTTGKAISGLPGEEVWNGVHVPLLLVAGESDTVTKPAEVSKILGYFGISRGFLDLKPEPASSAEFKSTRLPRNSLNGKSPELRSSDNQLHEKAAHIHAFIFPSPASHGLLYDRATYRALSGVIQDFLAKDIDPRLNIGWQLQHLTTSGKWDVKNLEKWKAVQPVSKPIGETFFALKTLREVDEEHSPVPFAQRWQGRIFAIIDISHESPVYSPDQLEKCGIQYHKLPTVSKIPPTVDEVAEFVSLVDRLEKDISAWVKEEGGVGQPRPLIGVHCHYGFNRTGFFLVSYLIERKHYTIEKALKEFERCRSPGIRHPHFIDALYVRYCVGLRDGKAFEL